MVNSVDQTQPANLEWQGKLAGSVSSKALFALYLAMHSQPGAQALTFSSESVPVKAFDVTKINHYRRAPFSVSERSVNCLNETKKLINQNDLAGALLWQTMHPDPLSVVNNPKKLPPDVKANCSYLTQRLLNQKSVDEIKVDETRLDDVITASANLLN